MSSNTHDGTISHLKLTFAPSQCRHFLDHRVAIPPEIPNCTIQSTNLTSLHKKTKKKQTSHHGASFEKKVSWLSEKRSQVDWDNMLTFTFVDWLWILKACCLTFISSSWIIQWTFYWEGIKWEPAHHSWPLPFPASPASTHAPAWTSAPVGDWEELQNGE